MRYNLVIAFCQQIPNSLSGHLTYSHLQKFGTEQSLCVYLVLLQKLFFWQFLVVVVVQLLAEQLLIIPEDLGLNLVIGNHLKIFVNFQH